MYTRLKWLLNVLDRSELEDKQDTIVFDTNHLALAASSIAAIYRDLMDWLEAPFDRPRQLVAAEQLALDL